MTPNQKEPQNPAADNGYYTCSDHRPFRICLPQRRATPASLPVTTAKGGQVVSRSAATSRRCCVATVTTNRPSPSTDPRRRGSSVAGRLRGAVTAGALWSVGLACQEAEDDGQQLTVVSPSQQAVCVAWQQTPAAVGLNGNVFAELLDD